MNDDLTPAIAPEDMADTLDWSDLEGKYSVTLAQKLNTLPTSPGCYLMKNAHNVVIYVGKAKALRNRVRQYFQKNADHTRRVQRMVGEIRDLEWIATDSEIEALILESNLIKKHHPTYNVRLRDDKSYPYIAVTLSDEWPRVVYMRKLRMQRREKDKYFGPYTDTEAVKETLRLIRRVFGVPCGYKEPSQSRGKACMYYHIGQCTGVCVGKVSREEYAAVIDDVMAFLAGKREELVDKLLAQMERASEELLFEKAAKLRNQVQALQKLIARQKVVSTAMEDQDVIALVTDNGNTCAEMFFVRGGKLIGQEHFMLQNASAEDLGESVQEFIKQYYDTAPYVPREVLLNADIDELDIIESWLRQKRGTKVDVISPKRGDKRHLVEMAKKNADLVLKQLKFKMETDGKNLTEELTSLQAAIGCPTLPRRIEAYDISNIQGYHTVASLVVFEDGQPKKAHYRKFKLKLPEGRPDDFAAMKEVITRRLSGSLRRSEAFAELPDLILVDGGKGQLNAAMEAAGSSLRNNGAPSPQPSPPGERAERASPEKGARVPMIGLAKRNEEIFKPGFPEPIILPRNSKGLHLIQRIRDEAHRFAITFHRSVRGKTVRASILNQIPGIGPTRRRALIRHFGSVQRIKDATIEELMDAPAMNTAAAEAVYVYFHNGPEELR